MKIVYDLEMTDQIDAEMLDWEHKYIRLYHMPRQLCYTVLQSAIASSPTSHSHCTLVSYILWYSQSYSVSLELRQVVE